MIDNKEKEQEKDWDFDSFLMSDFGGLSLDDACECCNSILDSLEYNSGRKNKSKERIN